MKKNRKFLSLFLSVLSCATLVSCGEGNKTSAPSNTGTVTTPSTPSTPSAPSSKPSTDENNSSKNEDEKKIYTIAELIAMMPSDGSVTTERYYVKATIKSIDDAGFGAMTIEDPTGTLSVYGTYSSDGAKRYSELDEKPEKGDTVLLYGTIQNYKNKTPEIKSGWIIEFTNGTPTWSEDDYTEMTIGEAREAAVDSLVKVTGVVSRITFANGMKPNGFIIVGDNSSIYVYDNQIAITVAVGNKITLLAKKTMFIASKEANSAKKFGYKGACQLIDGHLLSNDEATNDLDLSFAQEKTVKEVIETSPSANITSLIYHSNALIKRVQKEGQNFVNYYIDDLDGKTGSYVYTACDGNDFAWMDQYDGKICSVYYTALNAKSTSTGVLFRFLPIKIEDNNYQFNKADAPKFAVEYYGLEQFDTVYSADPEKEMLTSVTSDLLNFGTATLSYSSSNTDLAYFETGKDGKVIFHIKSGSEGTATITVTGHLDGQKDFSKTMNIKITKPVDVSLAVNVKAAIDASKGTELLVKGVIGPSLVNKNGFYLIDETGSLAVVMNSTDEFNGLQIGQKRVPIGVLGIIYESRPNVTSDAAGLCLKSGNAVILRGASDAINSNKAVAKALVAGIKRSGLPQDCVQLLEDTSRETAREMMRLNNYIDVLIPRGGAGLIKSVVQNATVPVIETGTGNCHIFVDETADLEMAKAIVLNAKVQRPGVCNAAEKLLVHEAVANEFLPTIVKALITIL